MSSMVCSNTVPFPVMPHDLMGGQYCPSLFFSGLGIASSLCSPLFVHRNSCQRIRNERTSTRHMEGTHERFFGVFVRRSPFWNPCSPHSLNQFPLFCLSSC